MKALLRFFQGEKALFDAPIIEVSLAPCPELLAWEGWMMVFPEIQLVAQHAFSVYSHFEIIELVEGRERRLIRNPVSVFSFSVPPRKGDTVHLRIDNTLLYVTRVLP